MYNNNTIPENQEEERKKEKRNSQMNRERRNPLHSPMRQHIIYAAQWYYYTVYSE
jgi:hypothetical protein